MKETSPYDVPLHSTSTVEVTPAQMGKGVKRAALCAALFTPKTPASPVISNELSEAKGMRNLLFFPTDVIGMTEGNEKSPFFPNGCHWYE